MWYLTVFAYLRGYPKWLTYDLYTTLYQHFKCIIVIKISIFDTHVSETHTYFTLIICPLTRQHFGSRCVLFDFYFDVIRIPKEIKLHSNVI